MISDKAAYLKNKIKAATEGADYPNVWYNIAQVILDFIKDKVEITSVYAGLIPGTPPITSLAVMATHKHMITPPHYEKLKIDMALAASSGNPAAPWIPVAVLLPTLMSVPASSDEIVITSTPFAMASPSVASPQFPPMVFTAGYEQNVMTIASAIIQFLLTATPVSPTIPATGADGSFGTISGMVIL